MNNLETNSQSYDPFSRGLAISFAAHVLLFSFFTLKAVFFTPETIDFTQAVKVDIVGLPDKVEPQKIISPIAEEAKPALPTKETPAAKPAVEPTPPKHKTPVVKAPNQKTDDGINLGKIKSKQQSAIDKLKALEAIEKIKEEAEIEKKAKISAAGKSNTGTQKIKGNVISPGSALTGLAQLQHDSYVSELDQHIKQNWSLPEWLSKRDLKAQVRVFIDSRGHILERKIIKSSGNPNYDEEVIATIDRSSPFPSPPEKFVSYVSVQGIVIGFPE